MTGWARRRLAHALDRRFEALHHRVDRVASRVEEVASRADQLAAVTAELRGVVDAVAARLHEEISPALRLMAGSDAESRRLLEAARRDPEYELAFEEGEPLVTAILPTHGRADFLRSGSLPAVLAQSHERLQVLVIGDGADSDAEAVVEEIGDSRAEWVALTQRYVYPDPHRHWQAASTLTRNEAVGSPGGGGCSTSSTTTRCRSMRSSGCSRPRAGGVSKPSRE